MPTTSHDGRAIAAPQSCPPQRRNLSVNQQSDRRSDISAVRRDNHSHQSSGGAAAAAASTSSRKMSRLVPSGAPNLAARRNNPAKLRGGRARVPKLSPAERAKIARERFRKAIIKVKVMIRFGLAPKWKSDDDEPKKKVHYANTYKMEPDPGTRFRPDMAEQAIRDVFDDTLRGYTYSKRTAPRFARAMSTMIVDKVKELGFDRYKFVCNVMFGESAGQCFDFTSRSLWFADTDTYATASLKSPTFFVVATVHAVYFD